MTPEEALQKAKEVCGSATELSRRIGVTIQAISQWKVAPPKRALEIERATDGQVTKEQLCPTMYPQENSEAA
jgi:DNA-binding transcriptional regulator YdaS (Cro superfamily)